MSETSGQGPEPRSGISQGQTADADDRQRRIDALRALAAEQRQLPGGPAAQAATPTPEAPGRGGTFTRQRARRATRGTGRARWLAGGAVVLVVVLLAVGALVRLRPAAHPTTAHTHAPADPLAIALGHGPVACPAGAAWSPDGKRVAVVGSSGASSGSATCGQSITIPGAGLQMTGPATGGTLAILDATTGATLSTTDVSETIVPAAVPESVRSAPAALANVALAYPQIIWAPDGSAIALTFAAINAPPDTGAVNERAVYGRGVLLLPTGGTARIILLPRPATPSRDSSVSALNQVDLATGTVTRHTRFAAVDYSWGAGELFPRTVLNGPNSPPPAIFATPIGNPDGDSDFTIWQSGTVSRPCVQRPGAPATGPSSCCVPPEYVVAALGALAAWSPDSRFLDLPVGGPLGATGRIPSPPNPNTPGACPIPSPTGGLAALPVRDPALAVVAANVGPIPGASVDVAWNASGKRLAVLPASQSGSAQPALLIVYDCVTGEQVIKAALPSLEPGIEQSGQGGPLSAPTWSPDGTRLLILDDSTQALVILGPKSLRG